MKQTVMLADKSGMRRKPKDGRLGYKAPSKVSEQDLIDYNRKAGDKLLQRIMDEGRLPAKEAAALIRNEIKSAKDG